MLGYGVRGNSDAGLWGQGQPRCCFRGLRGNPDAGLCGSGAIQMLDSGAQMLDYGAKELLSIYFIKGRGLFIFLIKI